jgi:hypothetical protein
MIHRIDELSEPPIAGRFYLVPCVHGMWCGKMGDWPVMGPKHDDARFLDFPWKHYHLNRFFLDIEDAINALTKLLHEPLNKSIGLSAPVLQRRKCVVSPLLGIPVADVRRGIYSHRWIAMWNHYANRQCKRGAGWICPHKGLDLGPIAPSADDYIICPLHGLRVHAGSGVVANG